jgi:hypothetical protein
MTDVRATIYREAAELLRKDGWTQHTGLNYAGNRCLTNATTMAGIKRGINWIDRRFGGFDQDSFFSPLIVALREQWTWNGPLTGWNDQPGRTVDEVITLLEQTAEKLEADETIA